MKRLLSGLLPLALTGCVLMPSSPERDACQKKVDFIAERLMPSFAKLGYQPSVRIVLSDDLPNSRGFPSPPDVLGDSAPGGRIRVRPVVCSRGAMALVVVAHEMSHAALKHMGTINHGVNLAWDVPKHEFEADALARQVLKDAGASKAVLDYLACRLGQCQAAPKGEKRKPADISSQDDMELR